LQSDQIDEEDMVMRCDKKVNDILMMGNPDRDTSKKLIEFDQEFENQFKDFKLKANFISCLHPDNLEKALVSYLEQQEKSGLIEYG